MTTRAKNPTPEQDQDPDVDGAELAAANEPANGPRGPVLMVLETGTVLDAPNKVATHHLDPNLGIEVPVRTYVDVPKED